jgi:hypothetical protein
VRTSRSAPASPGATRSSTSSVRRTKPTGASRVRYYWEEDIGTLYTLWNPFNDAHVHPQPRHRVIELRFDDASVLRDYEITGVKDVVALPILYPASRPPQP